MKIKAIINPNSGNRRVDQIREIVVNKLRRHLVDLEHTTGVGHAADIARQAVRRGVDTIVVAGGDGTANEVLNGVIGSDTAIGLSPTGTANDLADSFGIPTEAEQACDVILNGHSFRSDVIRVNDWHYLTVGGIGLPCHAVALAKAIRRHRQIGKLVLSALGARIYVVAALLALIKRSRYVSVRSQGWSSLAQNYSLLIGNQELLGRSFKVLPGAQRDDGRFDAFAIQDLRNRRRYAVTVLRTLNGTHGGRDDVALFAGSSMRIRTLDPVAFFGDGEIREEATDFRVSVLPRAAKIIVPADYRIQYDSVDRQPADQSTQVRYKDVVHADYQLWH